MTTAARKRANRPAAPRRDVYAEVTDRILAALDHGTVPWRQPWRAGGIRNAGTGYPYRGINVLLLALVALDRGYDDPRWLTYRQAQAAGGHVRRGEEATRVILWRWLKRRDADSDDERERFPLIRWFSVFNVAQCEGLPFADAEEASAFDPLDRADAIASAYAGGPTVLHDADAAYYRPSTDEVHLPPRGAFRSADGYYATLFHELAHSTGHPDRLNREGFQSAVAFGSAVYSREELAAEFGAAFLCHEAGIDASRLDQSAAYIASWRRALADDRRMVVVAAAQGQRAADRILGVSREADDRPADAAP